MPDLDEMLLTRFGMSVGAGIEVGYGLTPGSDRLLARTMECNYTEA